MTAFDAELYLRLAAERLVLAGVNSRVSDEESSLTVAAQALVAIDAVDEAVALAVLNDYVLASAARGDSLSLHTLSAEDDESPPAVAVQPLTAPRVVSCDSTLDVASGTLHVSHVTLGADATTLAVVFRQSAQARPGSGMRVPGVTLGDDRGTSTLAHFGGGGSDAQWEGRFHADRALHLDTAYIEVDGHRIELESGVAVAELWIEDLPEQDAVLRYLWQCATPEGHMSETSNVELAIDAFVAAGAIASDDPALADIRLVAATLARGSMYGAPPAQAAQLPEPWRSMARPPTRRGPVGTVAVSAATPVFDGFAVAVSAIRSDENGWEVDVEVAPELEMFSPFDGPRARSHRLTWWAADDRGRRFLGSIGGWSGGDGSARGSIEFHTALDPKAKHLDLLPTASTQRAVIRVPLEWS